MTYKTIRLLKNKITGQIYQQTHNKKTLFHRFTERDYLEIGILLHYYFNIEKEPNAMDINLKDKNAFEIFSKRAQEYIRNDSDNIIKLSYFEGNNKEISPVNYVKHINKWKQENFKKLINYRQAFLHLTDNMLYLNYIKDNIIDIKEFFTELSSEFEIFEDDIVYRDLNRFQYWRNRIINDTVNNFEYSFINKNFLSFILLHLFILCEHEFDITDVEYIEQFDGGKIKTFTNLQKMIESKIKYVKNEIKKKKSQKKSRKRRT
jgi:hypothetical protein